MGVAKQNQPTDDGAAIMKSVSVYLLHSKLKGVGFREIRLTDESYVAPSLEWVKEFAAYLRQNQPNYFAQKFDCENFARWAACEADKSLYNNPDIKDAGHTFGEASCVIETNGRFGGHAMNIVLCDDENLYAFEPNGGVVTPVDEFAGVWTTVRV